MPYGAPRNFEGYNISATEIKLFWDDVEEELKNGEIQGYKVFYREDGAKEKEKNVPVNKVNPNSTPMTTTLSGLSMYKLYNISIVAYTSPGNGIRSQAIYIWSDSGSKLWWNVVKFCYSFKLEKIYHYF